MRGGPGGHPLELGEERAAREEAPSELGDAGHEEPGTDEQPGNEQGDP